MPPCWRHDRVPDGAMVQDIFCVGAMLIGFASMERYFAVKGTGDVGKDMPLDDGTVATKAESLLICRTAATKKPRTETPWAFHR